MRLLGLLTEQWVRDYGLENGWPYYSHTRKSESSRNGDSLMDALTEPFLSSFLACTLLPLPEAAGYFLTFYGWQVS